VQNTDILNLPGWQVIDCDASEDCYAIQAKPCRPRCACLHCGSLAFAKHGTQVQTLRDLPCYGKHVTIYLDRQRNRCLACRKTQKCAQHNSPHKWRGLGVRVDVPLLAPVAGLAPTPPLFDDFAAVRRRRRTP
jgi:transposase